MKKSIVLACAAFVIAAIIGCQSAPKEAVSADDAILELAQSLVQKALKNKFFAGPNARVMAIGRFINDTTTIRRDSFEFMKSQITTMFSDSGKVVISAAFGDSADDRTPGMSGNRPLAPSLVLTGNLTQRNSRGKDGTAQNELSLDLSIMDVVSGVRLWNGRKTVVFAVHKDEAGW